MTPRLRAGPGPEHIPGSVGVLLTSLAATAGVPASAVRLIAEISDVESEDWLKLLTATAIPDGGAYGVWIEVEHESLSPMREMFERHGIPPLG